MASFFYSVNTVMQYGDEMFEKVGIVHISLTPYAFQHDFKNTLLGVCQEVSIITLNNK